KTFPAAYSGYQWAKPHAGGSAMDSDVDLGTGCTHAAALGVGHRAESTLDAGIVPPRNRVGQLLWLDRNANGTQDPDEPGAAGTAVTMNDATGKPVATARTGPDGRYLLDDLPDGAYQVCFDLTVPTLAGYR